MNKHLRIIPRLDVKGPNLVKGIHLEGLRVLGKPNDYAQHYYENGADEIFFQDSVASLYNRNNLDSIVKQTAKNVFIPIAVGGGIRTLEDIRSILRAGADKVSINTAALKDPNFLKKAVSEFGSSTIISSMEVIETSNNRFELFTDCGREETNIEVSEWINRVHDLGVGEILITSVDNEGAGKGFNLKLIELTQNIIEIPYIIHGGPGNFDHIKNVLENQYRIDGLALASILHYDLIDTINNMSQGFEDEGNIEFLRNVKNVSGRKRINPTSIKQLKNKINKETNYKVRNYE